jgi:hypothetical protein
VPLEEKEWRKLIARLSRRKRRSKPRQLKRRYTPYVTVRYAQKIAAENNFNQKQLAEHLGVSAGLLSRALSLLNLPWQVMRMVCRETISLGAGYYISTIKGRKNQIQIAHRVAAQKLRACDVATLINIARFLPKPLCRWSWTVQDGIRIDIESNRPLSLRAVKMMLRREIKKSSNG